MYTLVRTFAYANKYTYKDTYNYMDIDIDIFIYIYICIYIIYIIVKKCKKICLSLKTEPSITHPSRLGLRDEVWNLELLRFSAKAVLQPVPHDPQNADASGGEMGTIRVDMRCGYRFSCKNWCAKKVAISIGTWCGDRNMIWGKRSYWMARASMAWTLPWCWWASSIG